MKNNTVYIFPDTMPRVEVLFPLVQVFESIVYLRSVENDDPDAGEQTSLYREMLDQGLVRFDCPAPLAENRDRFLQLVHDLQHRRDDYAGQLSNLSLAALGSRKGSESKTSIIGTLLKQTGIEQTKEEEQRAMVLWQARLVLKLGEIFDREQEELKEHLNKITDREQGLLEKLREENEQPFSLTRALNNAGSITDGQLHVRLKAWSRLFALGRKQAAGCVFLTTNRETLDQLTEQYELLQKQRPRRLLSLLLPGGRAEATFTEHRAAFREEGAQLLDALDNILQHPDTKEAGTTSALIGTDSDWGRLLEHHFPAAANSRCTLTFYVVPGITPTQLFLESFGRSEDKLQIPDVSSPDATPIIAILEEYGRKEIFNG